MTPTETKVHEITICRHNGEEERKKPDTKISAEGEADATMIPAEGEADASLPFQREEGGIVGTKHKIDNNAPGCKMNDTNKKQSYTR